MDGATGDMAADFQAAMTAATPAATTDSTQTPPASATTTPAVESSTAATQTTPETEPGPVPYARFKEVNESSKRYEEQLKQYAWLKPEHQQELQRFYQRVSGDNPLEAYLDELGQLVRARPDLAGPMKSWAARTLGTRAAAHVTAAVEPETETEPQPDIQLEDGRGVYSAQQQAKLMAFHRKQWDASVNERLQPLQETANQQKADALIARVQAESTAAGLRDVAAMKTQPHFEDLRPEMLKLMQSDDKLSLEGAYNRAFLTVIVPQYAAGKAAALQQKVGASSANPSRPSGAPQAPPRDFREALERELAGQR